MPIVSTMVSVSWERVHVMQDGMLLPNVRRFIVQVEVTVLQNKAMVYVWVPIRVRVRLGLCFPCVYPIVASWVKAMAMVYVNDRVRVVVMADGVYRIVSLKPTMDKHAVQMCFVIQDCVWEIRPRDWDCVAEICEDHPVDKGRNVMSVMVVSVVWFRREHYARRLRLRRHAGNVVRMECV